MSAQLRDAVTAAIASGMTRYAVAKLAGVSPAVLFRWYDKGGGLKLETAEQLAKAFKMRLTAPRIPKGGALKRGRPPAGD